MKFMAICYTLHRCMEASLLWKPSEDCRCDSQVATANGDDDDDSEWR